MRGLMLAVCVVTSAMATTEREVTAHYVHVNEVDVRERVAVLVARDDDRLIVQETERKMCRLRCCILMLAAASAAAGLVRYFMATGS